jgi:hypothetical protein
LISYITELACSIIKIASALLAHGGIDRVEALSTDFVIEVDVVLARTTNQERIS